MSDLVLVRTRARMVAGLCVLVLGADALLVALGRFVRHAAASWTVPLPRVLAEFTYLLGSIVIAVFVVAIVRARVPKGRRYLVRGDLEAPAGPVAWLGIRPGASWRTVGRTFAVVLTLLTAVAVFLQVLAGHVPSVGKFALAFVFALPCAAINAAVEEGVFRLAVIEQLDGVLPPRLLALLSGALFGTFHFFGVPGGVPGGVLACFLGWLLAKSMLETRGIVWAWRLHFLQDVVIFTALFAM